MAVNFIAEASAARLQDTDLELVPASMHTFGEPFPYLTVPGYVVTLPGGRSARKHLEKLGFSKPCYGIIQTDGAKPSLAALYAPSLETSFVVSDRAHDILFQEFSTVGKLFEDLFRQFMNITGKEMRVEVSTLTTGAPPKSDDGKLRVLVGYLPLGPLAESRIKELPEQNRSFQRLCFIHDRPALGAGTVVYDANGIAVAQIIDEDLYLFLRIGRSDLLLFKEAFVSLLGEVLSLAWEANLKREPVERTFLTDAEALTSASEAWVDSLLTQAEASVKESEEKVRAAEKAYTKALNEWKGMQIAVRSVPLYREKFQTQRPEMIESWKDVLGHPLTDTIEAIEQGFHLTTKELVIEHESKEYRLGTFGIRLDLQGEFTVWNLHPTHPDGELHPHISQDGTVCYGNVTLAIRERITVKRDYPGAMLMVLDWLAYGYEPASTLHPIEEWPTKETT